MREEHEEEREVLQSIYEGDNNFSMINETTFQYKYGEEGENRSFLVEISWGADYPDDAPSINLDLFYNKHIVGTVKEKILSGLKEQAEINLGMSMTFTLFEWLKEAKEELLEEQPIEAPVNRITEINAEVNQMTINDDQGEGKKDKKEQLTKAQKRRMWDRQNAAGERARGYNWVDIIKHLSQTGGSKNDG
ncbi:RWD domain-containing protein 4-like [Penaeus japonicus]|uniref:RWD domain-containing protein 4-like n=1 Tax=Penaeus japonicus TaxID=27405 RepID=UPI001C71199C|nr:RWD domain-containing protein 4-like [Penaeus japonicus]XP_042871326.1 RWD domain-containing protein 4-like [Penaeus japonicus]